MGFVQQSHYRTNVHHTLKQKPLTHGPLEDFVLCYNPVSRLQRKATWSNEAPDGRWRVFSREELLQRDKASLDLFWLKDATMTDLETLPDPDVLISEIMENLEAAMEQFVAASRT
jgi:type I restriction enzyme M protein